MSIANQTFNNLAFSEDLIFNFDNRNPCTGMTFIFVTVYLSTVYVGQASEPLMHSSQTS